MKTSLYVIVLAALIAIQASALPSNELYARGGKGKAPAKAPAGKPGGTTSGGKPGGSSSGGKPGGSSGGGKPGGSSGGGGNPGGSSSGGAGGSGGGGGGKGNGGQGKIGPNVNFPGTQSLTFTSSSSAQPRPTGSMCNGITGGASACVPCVKKANCGFDPVSKTCKPRVAGLITSTTECGQAGTSANIRNTAQTLWNTMRNHIFNGEPGNPQSGRHTYTSWRAANRDPGRCDSSTHLCAFRLPPPNQPNGIPKTIWDDRNPGYTQADIETMCKTVIALNIKDTGGTASHDGAFVVQTKFNKPICVRHQVAGTGSCFPVGIHFRTSPKIGEVCSETTRDIQPIQGVTQEIPAGNN